MNEPPHEWLRRLFEFEYCPECGGDAEDHEVCLVLGNYFARCKHDPFADTTGEGTTINVPDGTPRCSTPRPQSTATTSCICPS
jgi:hypothetical protein